MAAFNSPQPLRFNISECSVCLEAYDPQERIPRLLKACGHTFCELCLIQLKDNATPSTSVRCPSCRKKTKLREKEPFPKNYALLENIGPAQQPRVQQAESSEAKQCDRCSNQPAECSCRECAASLCTKCWGEIHNFGSLRSHAKVDSSKVVEAYCTTHPSNTADLVCCEKTCASYGSLICLLCEKSAAHNGHLTAPIEHVAEKKREELRKAIKKAQKNVDFALSVLVRVQENDELLSRKDQINPTTSTSSASAERASISNRDQAVNSINATVDALIENLNRRRSVLIEQVDTLVRNKAEKLEEQRTELETFLSRSYALLHEASQVLGRSNDRDLISVFRAYYKPLIEISKTQISPQPAVTPLVYLSFPHSFNCDTLGVLKDDSKAQKSSYGFSGTFLRQFGIEGSRNGQFKYPQAIAFGADGLLYVSDNNNHRIQVLRSDGSFVRKFGSNGSGVGQFQQPRGLTFSPHGLLYVCDYANHRIQAFQRDGTFVRAFGAQGSKNGQFNHPWAVAFDAEGLCYVSDQSNHRIQVVRSDGTFVRKFGSKGSGNGQFSNPSGLTFSPNGLLYVCDYSNHRIQVFRSDGTFVRKFGSQGAGDGQFMNPWSVAFSPDGFVYVSDYSNHRIQVFRSQGTFVRKLGSNGTGDGRFSYPCGIGTNVDGLLYVCDLSNNRIQVFQ